MAARRRSRGASWVLFIVLVLVAVVLYRVTRDPWPAVQGESVAPDEPWQTARIVAASVRLAGAARADGRAVARAQGAKAHACARASFTVGDVDPRLRYGLFARRGEYPAWVRFSSMDPRSRSDQERDGRGLAVKVMGVAGRKLLATERDEATQDFVLADARRFPLASPADYAELLDRLSRGDRYGFFLDDWSFRFWRWRLRELWLYERSRGTPPSSLLQTDYYGGTAYRLGPQQYVKYAMRPCVRSRPPRQNRTDDMLRVSLREELGAGGACFDLLVQLQVPGRNMPVEDASVLWSEKESPFLPAARLTLPQQAFDSPDAAAPVRGVVVHPVARAAGARAGGRPQPRAPRRVPGAVAVPARAERHAPRRAARPLPGPHGGVVPFGGPNGFTRARSSGSDRPVVVPSHARAGRGAGAAADLAPSACAHARARGDAHAGAADGRRPGPDADAPARPLKRARAVMARRLRKANLSD